MKPKSFILFALAAGCGLVAMMGVKQVMSSNKAENAPEETVKVLYAKSDIPAHVPLDDKYVEFREVKKSAAQFGAVTTREEYDQRALRTAAVKDEPIMKAKLSDKGAFDAATLIPAGMRMVSVPVNLTTSHSGLVRPGDRVDILVTYDASLGTGSKPITTTRTVLEYIEVFAIDSLTEGNDPNQHDILAKNVSLLLTPQQAQIAMLAQKEGAFHLALRGKNDDSLEPLEPVNEIDDLQRGSLLESKRESELLAQINNQKSELEKQQKMIDELKNKKPQARVTNKPAEINRDKMWPVKVYANDKETTTWFDAETKAPTKGNTETEEAI